MEATSIQNQNRHAVFPIFLWGFVLFCVFGLLAIAAVRWFGNFQSYDEQRALERAKVYAEYRETMNTNLNTLKWVDDQKQAAQVPITEAMKLTVNRLNAKKVSASSVAIAVPGPTAAAAPSPTEEGAPAQSPQASQESSAAEVSQQTPQE